MKSLTGLLLATILLTALNTKAQTVPKPVKWRFDSQKLTDSTYSVLLTATVDKPWHIYSQHIAEGGPVKTTVSFTPSKYFALSGEVAEIGNAIKKNDPTFEMVLIYFESKVVFKQVVKVKAKKTTVNGAVEFMVCNDRQCLPPETVPFSISLQ